MNDPQTLGAMGLELPSASYIIGMVMFSFIGYAAYRYGKRTERSPVMWLGVALMLYGYVVSTELWMWIVGLALCAGLYVLRNE